MFEHPWTGTSNYLKAEQKKSIKKKGNLREKYLGNTKAPVVLCYGNHCFVEYHTNFGQEIYFIDGPATSFTIKGIKFGGFRGTKYINSFFPDGLKNTIEAASRLENDLDVVVTHAPPQYVLDNICGMWANEHVGMIGLKKYIDESNENNTNLRLSLFGHIHEEFGSKKLGNVLCCNSAEGYTVLDRDDKNNWNVVEAKNDGIF
jgi:Icc-related predicted phosphoesterase